MARYALDAGKNEFTAIREVRGTLATDVKGAFAEMEALAQGTRCRDFLYHAQINPEKGDPLSPEQWQRAVDLLEKNLKLEGHQRVVFEHIKDGRQHYHVVWNRIDAETMKAVNMGHNYRAHERTGAQLEKEFALEPLERRPNLEGGRRGERAPASWEYRQAQRTGLDPREMKAEVKALREQSANGTKFSAALAAHGYTLAKGDRRDFLIIDGAGGEHSLGRYAGMKAGELREFMHDVDRVKLPTVSQVREAEREGVAYHHTPEIAKNQTAATIFQAFQATENAIDFAGVCRANGVWLAEVSPTEARENNERREELKAEGAERAPLKLRAGEIVAVNVYGNVYRLNERTTGAGREHIAEKTGGLTLPSLQEATKEAREARSIDVAEKRAEWDRAHPKPGEVEKVAKGAFRTAKHVVEDLHRPGKERKPDSGLKVGKTLGSVGDRLASTVDSLLDMLTGAAQPRAITSDEYRKSAAARQEYYEQQAERQRKRQERGNVLEQVRLGREVDPAVLSSFTREDLQLIKDRGVDTGIRMLIEDERKRKLESGRERER